MTKRAKRAKTEKVARYAWYDKPTILFVFNQMALLCRTTMKTKRRQSLLRVTYRASARTAVPSLSILRPGPVKPLVMKLPME